MVPNAYWRVEDLKARYSCSTSTINRWILAGILPKPVQFTPGGPRFFVPSEVEQADAQVLANRDRAA